MVEKSHNLGLLFEGVVDKYINLNAIIFNKEFVVTYGELDRLSNQVGNTLKKNGLNNEDVVLISGDKSLSMFATIIAALKLGIVYCVYDPMGPVDRLKRISNACKPKLIINSSNYEFSLDGSLIKCPVINYQEIRNQALLLTSERNTEVFTILGSQLAYIMFTSGSTGTPKGVMISHDNVRVLLDWSIDNFLFGPGELLANVNPSYFDNFVFDFYSSLFSGAAIVPFNSKDISNPNNLLQSIDDIGCTSWFSVPTMLIYLQNMRLLNKDSMKSIRRIIFGGEGYPKSKLVDIFNIFKDRVDFYNVYGPTECTCICSCYKVSQGDFKELDGFLPLGFMLPNFKHYVVDGNLKPLGSDSNGELCIYGPAVGQGYCNNISKTEEVFIKDPFCLKYNRIIYRTGDIVNYNSKDGKLRILGRMDNQVKHMGYRIELEEIEICVIQLQYVNQACCIHGVFDNLSMLKLFVSTNKDITIKNIRDDISALIPKYMMPSKIYIIDSFPINSNGKIDRKTLSLKAQNL